jgi:hypothetical protein
LNRHELTYFIFQFNMTDELAALGDLGAVAVNAGELAQRIENNLEREFKGKIDIFVKFMIFLDVHRFSMETSQRRLRTPPTSTARRLSRLANERAELIRELERIDEHCAALETGRAAVHDARERAETARTCQSDANEKQEVACDDDEANSAHRPRSRSASRSRIGARFAALSSRRTSVRCVM